MNFNQKFWIFFDWLILKFTTVLYIGLILICFFNVVGRFFFNTPLVWGDEASLYVVAWFVFFSSAICTKEKKHIYVEAVRDRFNGLAQLIISCAVNILCLLLMIVLTIYTYPLMEVSKNDISATLYISRFWVYLGVFLGSLITVVSLIRCIFEDIYNYLHKELPV